jgi:hypothetical protein
MAAARDDDRDVTRAFLAEARESAVRLGRDANYVWTAFGPTNVRIHEVGDGDRTAKHPDHRGLRAETGYQRASHRVRAGQAA